jgi:hypothetical protein
MLTDSLWLDVVHARAQVRWLPADKSGRDGLISSGIRCHASFGRKDLHLCQIRIEKAEAGTPGGESEITIAFAAPKGLGDRLVEGAEFDLLESMRTIGRGKITQDLRKLPLTKRLGL